MVPWVAFVIQGAPLWPFPWAEQNREVWGVWGGAGTCPHPASGSEFVHLREMEGKEVPFLKL